MAETFSPSVQGSRRPVESLVVCLVFAVGATFLPAGPLTLLASIFLVVSASHRLCARLAHDDDLARIGVTLLLSMLQIAATAELLSLWTLLNRPEAWLAVQSAVWFVTRFIPPPVLRYRQLRYWWRRCRRLPALVKLGLGVFLLLAGGNLVLAFLAGITEYDSVTTYVPYTIDFVQQGSLAYPPHAHQADVSAWAAPVWFLMNWHKIYAWSIVVSGSMVMLNVLGWIATAGAFVATLAICANLRLPAGLSLVACIAVFSAPQFIAQSANTMYDQVQAFTMAMVVLAFLKALRQPGWGWPILFALAHVAVIGMKLTAAFMVVVLGVMDLILLGVLIYRRHVVTLLATIAVGVIGLAALVAPHFARNLHEYGALMPGSHGVEHAVDRAKSSDINVLKLRCLKCLIPFELGHVLDKPPSWLSSNWWFRRALWGHVSDRYTEAASYFGILPPLLLLLLVWVTLVPARRSRHRWRWLAILWSCFAAWMSFQFVYARLFDYTPWNGRYMLICWFLAAPALAAALAATGRWVRMATVVVVVAFSVFESVDFFIHRERMPFAEILNMPRSDHFRRDPRYPRSNIPAARALLDAHDAYTVYTNVPGFLRLVYYDDMRRRRIIYKPDIEFDGCEPLIANAPTSVVDDPAFWLHYRTFIVRGDVHRRGQQRVVLVPQGRLRPAPAGFVDVSSEEADRVRVLSVAVGDAIGGELEGRDDDLYVWLGPRGGGSLCLHLQAEAPREVWLLVEVRKAGVALDSETCPIEVYNCTRKIDAFEVSGPGRYLARVSLRAGRNAVRFVIPQNAGPRRYAGDQRPTMLLIDGLGVLPIDAGLDDDMIRSAFADNDPNGLVHVDDELTATVQTLDVGVAASMSGTIGLAHPSAAWLGPWRNGELRIMFRADRQMPIQVLMRVEQFGIALGDESRCPLDVIVNDQIAARGELRDAREYRVPLTLAAGVSTVTLRVPQSPDGERYGDDPRPTMARISDIELRPADAAPPAGAADLPAREDDPGEIAAVDADLRELLYLSDFGSGAMMGPLELYEGVWTAWMGPHEAGQLRLGVHARRRISADLSFRVVQLGCALPDDNRCPLDVYVNGQPVRRLEITEPGPQRLALTLDQGENSVVLRIPQSADRGRYGGDRRPTMLYVAQLRLVPPESPGE